MSLIKKTSILSDSRFPSFIRGNPEFDVLRKFVKSYFESIEVVGQANHELLYAQDNSDVDTVTSNFLDNFYSSLCPELPSKIMADKRLLLKHSRELYQKKGTPDSFKLLFKLLYNETINIKYPSENILRASDGKWNQTHSIHVTFPNVDEKVVYGLVGHEFSVRNASGVTRNTIIQVRKILGTDVYEISVDKQKNTRFSIGDSFFIDDITGTIVPSTQSIKILKQGRNFKVGQIVKLDVKDGSGTGSLAKITEVTSIGGIKNIKIIKFGSGYNADFNLTIFADTTGITNVAGGDFEGGVLPLKETTYGFNEYGVVSKIGSYGDMKDYFLQDYILEDYISTPHAYFAGVTQTSSIYNSNSDYFLEDYILGDYTNVFTENDLDAYAIISVEVGALLTYPGFWTNNNGSLSNPLICLQDNHLYQNFSYMIQSSVSRDKFVGVVKNLLHPAGMLMFSDLLLENNIDVSNRVIDDSKMYVDMFIKDISEAHEKLALNTNLLAFDTVLNDDIVAKTANLKAYDDVLTAEEDSYGAVGYYQSGYVRSEFDGVVKHIYQQKFDSVGPYDDDTIFKHQFSKFDDAFGLDDEDINLIQDRYLHDQVETVSTISHDSTITLADYVDTPKEFTGYFGGDYNEGNEYAVVKYGPIFDIAKITTTDINVIDTPQNTFNTFADSNVNIIDNGIDKNVSPRFVSNVSIIDSGKLFDSKISIITPVVINETLNQASSKVDNDFVTIVDNGAESVVDMSLDSQLITNDIITKTDITKTLESSTNVEDQYGSDRGLNLTDSVTTPEVAPYTNTRYVDDSYYVDNVDGFVIKHL